MTQKFTREEFTNAMRKVVAEHGEDYVYIPGPFCVYRNEDGSSSCLIGHALSVLGIQVPDELNAEPIEDINDDQQYTEDEVLIFAMQRAQEEQDRASTWGTALGAYLAVLEGSDLV